MEYFTNIRNKIGYWILNKKTKELHRRKTFHNFDSAKNAVVIFSAKHQESYLQAKNFIYFLTQKNINVHALGYVENKYSIAYFPYKKGIDFFSIGNKNWYNKPLNTSVQDFINLEVDLLIDLSVDINFPLTYVLALSKAKMKISRCTQYEQYCDLMIKTDSDDPEFYLEQIKHYMVAIRVN